MSFENINWPIIGSNLSLLQLTKTEHRQFIEENRNLTQEQVDKLSELCNQLIYPIQQRFGAINVISGYRCMSLNRAIGSGDSSQHPKCEAIDFDFIDRPRGAKLKEVFNWIVSEKLAYGQLIYELGEWIHISLGYPYRDPERCRQAFDYDGKKYIMI